MHDDATQPRREDVIPPDVDIEARAYEEQQYSDDDDYGDSGPGCLAWGIMGLFAIVLSVAIVITAIFAGFNQGLSTANVTADAATAQNIGRQCEILPTDIAANRFDVVEQRFNSMIRDGVLPECASVFVQQATDAFQQSQITPTTPATATPEAIVTQDLTPTVIVTTETITGTESPYDLNGLLTEARTAIGATDYDSAIETLDAIRAIDPNFETTTVTGLLFNALTQQATREFRSPEGSLARGILLTNRAEQFGDVITLDVNFERTVAEYYLDAQAVLGLNFTEAIRLLNQVISLSANYPRGTGQAASELLEQYEAYGDALLAGGDACLAVPQFDAALASRPNDVALQSKADTAQQQCTFGAPATLDPNATVDPNATIDPNATQPSAPAVTPTQGVAPVGQQ